MDYDTRSFRFFILIFVLFGFAITVIHLNDANKIAREQRDAAYEQTGVVEDVYGELADIRCLLEQIVSGDVPPSTPPPTTGSSDPGKNYPSTTVPTDTVQTNPDNPNEQVPPPVTVPPPDGGPVTGCIASPSVAPG